MQNQSQISIGFLCLWTSERARTWSRTPLSLFEAFQSNPAVNLIDLPLRFSELTMFVVRAVHLRLFHKRLFSVWRTGVWFQRAATGKVEKLLRSQRNFNVLLSIGVLANVDNPQYIYQDFCYSHLLNFYKERGYLPISYDENTITSIRSRADFECKVYEKSAGVFTMSEWDRKAIIKLGILPPEKVVAVAAGINIKHPQPDVTRFQEADPNRIRKILFIGRWFFCKAGDIVVEAVNTLVHNSNERIQLTIAGPKRWPLQGEIPAFVEFLGDVPSNVIRRCLEQADVLMLPSRFEAFGIAAVEALSMGVPVIGRNDFAMPEFIVPGVNGELVSNDDPQAMAEKIDFVMNNTAIRVETAQRAKHVAEFYSWDRVADDMVTFMKQRLASLNN